MTFTRSTWLFRESLKSTRYQKQQGKSTGRFISALLHSVQVVREKWAEWMYRHICRYFNHFYKVERLTFRKILMIFKCGTWVFRESLKSSVRYQKQQSDVPGYLPALCYFWCRFSGGKSTEWMNRNVYRYFDHCCFLINSCFCSSSIHLHKD